MTRNFSLNIEPLASNHDRWGFSCGVEALDETLQRFGRQHANANVSRTYVAADGSAILGFYSLARLAVDLRHNRQGIGELILADALQRCLRFSEEIAMIGVVVGAKDDHARGWYERYEFERLPDLPLTLWLPAAAIARL